MLHVLADSVLKRLRRFPLYYQRYNNTLNLTTNLAYTRFAQECAAHYERTVDPLDSPPSPVSATAAMLLRGVFPREKALAYSTHITELVECNDPAVSRPKGEEHLSLRIKEPLKTLDAGLLDVLRSPEVHRALLQFFRGHYRIAWVVCYRSLPTERVSSSWLWHADCFPPHTCKMFLHLTPATADTGAMELMTRADTMMYRRAGYFGQYLSERYADLQDFAKDHGLPYRPFHFEAAPGDATIFDMNCFHRAVPPRTAFRDVIQFFFLPNMIPWEEQLHRDGIDSVGSQAGGGFPKDPRVKATSISGRT